MATVTGLTAARMQEIIDATIVDADVVGDNLILTKDDGGTINCGSVRGPAGVAGAAGAAGAAGPEGPPGSVNAIYSDIWSWTTSLTAASSSGQIGLNAATWAAATQINMNEATKDGRNVSVLAFPRINIGDQLYLQHKTDPTRYAYYTVSGTPVDNGTWWAFPVTFDRGTGAVPGGTSDTNVSLMKAGAGSVPVQDEGTLLTARSKLNFIGAAVAAADDAANDRTNVTISGPDALSATTPGKVAWEQPAGTDIIEIYGLDTPAGAWSLLQSDDFASDPFVSNWLKEGASSLTWNSGSSRLDQGGTSQTSDIRWVQAGLSAAVQRMRASVILPAGGAIAFRSVWPGWGIDNNNRPACCISGNAMKIQSWDGGSFTDLVTGTARTAGDWNIVGSYTVEAERNADLLTYRIWKPGVDPDANPPFDTLSTTLTGTPKTKYGVGVALWPQLNVGEGGGTPVSYDNAKLWEQLAEQRDLFIAITPNPGSRVVKRLYGSLGAAFRSDFVQPVDLLPYSLAGVVYSPNTRTADYTLVLADAGKTVEMNLGSTLTVTVPPSSSVAYPIGTIIEVSRYGSGGVTIAAGSGVTIRSRAGLLTIGNRYGAVSLRKRAADEWVLVGDLA